MASKQQHFLLIPYSEQGHINPMLSLASRLVRLGCMVTFVKADKPAPTPAAPAQPQNLCAKSQAPTIAASPTINDSAAQERLRFVALPVRNNAEWNNALCVDPNTMTRYQIFKNTLASLEDRHDLVAAIIQESNASSYPITCIICDSVLWKWVRHVARAHGLRSAELCIISALSFYTTYLQFIGKDEEIEEIRVSQFGMPSKKDSSTYFGLSSMKDAPELKLQKLKFFCSLCEGIEEANHILINSFKTLEAPLLPSLEASCFNVTFIGPCLPEWHKDNVGVGSSMAQQAGSIFKEDTTCLTWLDQQEKGSVLFVSFGSEGDIEAKQVAEIELGIEKSGYKFLWVVRPNALESSRPVHGLRERINGQEKVMFVSWAPQIRVLQHHAVGGFLTHSGWNSTLESLTFGVPMLCFPIFADHPLIANFVHHYLQVGIRVSTREGELVHREEVASGVQAIMEGRFSQRVAQVRELAQLAIKEANHNLTSFVQAMD